MATPFSLLQMLGRNAPALDIVDVGAMDLPGEPPWYEPLTRNGARLVGFEAIPEECAKLNASARKNQTFLPYAIGDGTERTFHVCSHPMTSSLYEPNTRLLSHFNQLVELTTVVRTITMQTKRLDDIPEVKAIDYLKLDVQGAELDVLRNAERLLEGVLVAQLEVTTVPMYVGQPLIGDIDCYMRSKGFYLFRIPGFLGRGFRPIVAKNDPSQTVSQHMWADAVYVRNFMNFASFTPEQLLKTAIILHDVYGAGDFAAFALQHHDTQVNSQVNKGYWAAYMQRLTGVAPKSMPPLP